MNSKLNFVPKSGGDAMSMRPAAPSKWRPVPSVAPVRLDVISPAVGFFLLMVIMVVPYLSNNATTPSPAVSTSM